MAKQSADPLEGGRSQAVHRVLKRAIMDLALSPGTKLPEDALGERLGVSRTLIRQALVRLSGEGLVELRPNRGAIVSRPTLEEGRDLFRIRVALERLAVETLAGVLTKAQVAELAAHIDDEEAVDNDNSVSIRLAGEFHTLLASMTRNATLSGYINDLVARSSLILALYGRPHSSECAVSEHRALLEYLIAGNADKAAKLMVSHLDSITTRALLPKGDGNAGLDALSAYVTAEGLL